MTMPPGPPMPGPMIFEKITFNGADVEVARSPDGNLRILLITLPIGIQYVLPLTVEVAKRVGMQLTAPGIVQADGNGQPPPGIRG